MKRNTYITLMVLLLALVTYFLPKSKHLADLNIKSKHGDMATVYLTTEGKSEEDCLITDKYATTLRRSDEADDVRKSWCYYASDKSVIVQRKKKKSFLLIPSESFSSGDLHQVNELKLEWIILYKNRIEEGKYLKIVFPEDSWREHKRNKKVRRVIGLYTADKIFALDTLLRPVEKYEIDIEIEKSNYVIMKIPHEENICLPSIIMSTLEQINFKDYMLKNFRGHKE